MKVTVEINTDNEAFANYPEGEIARILKKTSDRLIRDGMGTGFSLYDFNGNKVGTFSIYD